MPEYISGRPISVQTLIENMLVNAGIIKLVKDGGATGSLRFTRDYKVYHKGKPTDIKIRFTYNKRDNWADMAITYEDLTELRMIQKIGGSNARLQVYETKRDNKVYPRDEKARGLNGSEKPYGLSDSLQASRRQV